MLLDLYTDYQGQHHLLVRSAILPRLFFFHILANLQKVKMRKEAKIKNKIFSNEM
jgi:hypothetical protein